MCGSTTATPKMANPQLAGYGINENLGAEGTGFLSESKNSALFGLPEELKSKMRADFEARTGAGYKSALQGVNELVASGKAPTGAGINALADLGGKIGIAEAGFEGDLSTKDYEAKETKRAQALNTYATLLGLSTNMGSAKNRDALTKAGMENEFNWNKYKVDKENEFNWGSFLGDLIGAGAKVGSRFIKPGG